jgi:hypothetical protein
MRFAVTYIPLRSITAPYNLMLTESADVRLNLPFKSVEDVAMSIAQARNPQEHSCFSRCWRSSAYVVFVEYIVGLV